jgi:phosphonate transport system permease protein
MSHWQAVPDVALSRQQHKALFQAQGRYLRRLGLIALAGVLLPLVFYPLWHPADQALDGMRQIGRYILRMFVWQDFMHWPFRYYFTQIALTLAIVFAGTLTATFIALLLSFFAARNIMRGGVAGAVAFLMRRLFDVLRGIDMAIWGLIFVRAVGLGLWPGCWRSSCRTRDCWGVCMRKTTRRWTAHRGAG